MRAVVAGVIAAVMVAGCSSGSSDGKVRSEETRPAGSNTPSQSASSVQATPKQALATHFLAGNKSPELPAGKPGVLTVVAQAAELDGDSLPIIIRNNTTDTIVRPTAAASIRSAAGDLVATGEDQGFHPNVVQPGEIAIGYVYFEGGNMPAGSTVEFQLGGTPQDEDEFENIRDVLIEEVNFTGDRFIGKVQNPYKEPVKGPIDVQVTCFDDSGRPVTQYSDFAAPDDMPVGGTATFTIQLYDKPSCPTYILGSSGYSA